jgi:uncharacterized cupredoxin-like copper-binding protein
MLKRLVVIISMIIIAGCSTQSSGESQTVETITEEKQEYTIVSDNLKYNLDTIIVKKGKEVSITLINDGPIFHDWVVEGLDGEVISQSSTGDHGASDSHDETDDDGHGSDSGDSHGEEAGQTNIHVNAEAGTTGQISFIPTKEGEYTFYCSVPGHKEAGMVGKLIVKN